MHTPNGVLCRRNKLRLIVFHKLLFVLAFIAVGDRPTSVWVCLQNLDSPLYGVY